MKELHRAYLTPGLFGFGKLAGYDYFEHVVRELKIRFDRAGVALAVHVVAAPPTASIVVRARMLAERIQATGGSDAGPIHLLGHSTGGLDARLLVDPSVDLGFQAADLAFRSRVRSVVCMSTPHYGTPLAAYFTTAAGTRLLYLLSLLTVTSLSLGKLPLSIFAGIVASLSGTEQRFGIALRAIDDVTAQILRFVDDDARAQIADYLGHVHDDQAGITQLMPEVMELFNQTVHDHPDVRYGCVASVAPAPGVRRVLSTLLAPLDAAQLAIYTTVYGVASRASSRYPYATPTAQQLSQLQRAQLVLEPSSVDGIVPTLSMLWGELLWCGRGDHLDVVGHFYERLAHREHVDWLYSGAGFSRESFGAMLDAISAFMLRE